MIHVYAEKGQIPLSPRYHSLAAVIFCEFFPLASNLTFSLCHYVLYNPVSLGPLTVRLPVLLMHLRHSDTDI